MKDEINLDRHSFYNRLGEPIDKEKWLRYYDSPDYFKVCQSRVGDTEVVTEWTGIGEDDCIFQSIVRTHGEIQYMLAARTEEEAVKHHTILKDNVKYRQKIESNRRKAV